MSMRNTYTLLPLGNISPACMQPMHPCRNSPGIVSYIAVHNHLAMYTHTGRSYAYGTVLCPICVWDSLYAYGTSHTRIWADIRIWGRTQIWECFVHQNHQIVTKIRPTLLDFLPATLELDLTAYVC